MFAIEMFDVTSPGFVTFTRHCFGDLKAVKAFAIKSKESQLLSQIEKYERGEEPECKKATSWEDIPHLSPCKLIFEESMVAPSTDFKYLNTWYWPYCLRFDEAHIKQAVVQLDDKFYRIITGTIKNLSYESCDEFTKLNNMFWGQHGMIQVSKKGGDFFLSYRLFLTEKEYDTQEEALADCGSLEKINWSPFAEDIFGNG